MNYEDERYIRVFTRDTPTWCSWPWESRAIITPLMRKLDKTGRIEWPSRLTAAQALAPVLLFPHDVVEIGLAGIVATDTVTIGESWLWMPNFVPGQNARSTAKTPAERTRDWKTLTGYQHPPKPGGDVAETAEPHSLSSPSLPVPRSCSAKRAASKRPRKPAGTELEAHVLAELQSACRELTGNANAGPRKVTDGMRDSLAKLHAAEEPTAEEWTRVIRHRLAMDQRGEGYGELSWEHLCRPASFRRYRDAVERPTNGAKRPAVIDEHDVPDWMRGPKS